MVESSAKGLASRFYQIKTGHCLSGQYLNWTKNRPTLRCWWCFVFCLSYSHLAYLDYGGVHFDRFPAAVRALAARCKLSFAFRPGLSQR